MNATCPACGAVVMEPFHRQQDVPSHSCLLMDDPREAREFPRGTIELALCPRCGFVANIAVDETLQAYSGRYEETQGYSARFRAFADALAADLVERHGLHGKEVLEIGCGKGEFLAEICSLGRNRGIGIDPAIAPERLGAQAARIEWRAEYWTEAYGEISSDAVICRHTLEHVPRTRDFLALLRRSLPDGSAPLVFFELPDVGRVLREVAFWDLYYEHCSYYTPGSLARQFRACGFDVTRLELAFDDQYILLDARSAAGRPALELPDEPSDTRRDVETFRKGLPGQLERWRAEVHAAARPVIWGSGSKGVSFLTTLGIEREIELVVDINPHKHGKFMAGTGHRIAAPEELRDHRPDLVIAMNPAYLDEIGTHLSELGLDSRLVAV